MSEGKKVFSDSNRESLFKFYDSVKNREPKSWYKNFWVILLVELIGTFILVFGILLPSAASFGDWTVHQHNIAFWKAVQLTFTPLTMKALWVALLIALLVIPTIRISANFNPAVTIVEMGIGNDSKKLGFSKIGVQFLGGIAAGLFAVLVAHSINADRSSSNLDAIAPIIRHFKWSSSKILDPTYITIAISGKDLIWYTPLHFVMEFILTFLLLWSVFLFGEQSKLKRTLIITLMVWVIVTIGLRTNNIALNPARAFGPAFADLASGYGKTADLNSSFYIEWVWIIMAAEVLASFAFIKFRTHKLALEEEYVVYKKQQKENNSKATTTSEDTSTTSVEARLNEDTSTMSIETTLDDEVSETNDEISVETTVEDEIPTTKKVENKEEEKYIPNKTNNW